MADQENWEDILIEISEDAALKSQYPLEEYRKIANTVNTSEHYWVHKCLSRKFYTSEELCTHAKTPCEPTPPFLKASYSLNSYAKGKEWSAAFAITCLVYAENYGIANLQESHLNEIIWLSGLRSETLTNGEAINEGFYLPPEDAGGLFTCQEPVIIANMSIQSDYALKGEISFLKRSDEMLNALTEFLDSDSFYGILSIDEHSLALVKQEEDDNRYLIVFYPQPTDKNGKVTLFSRQGAGACLKKFPEESLEVACKDLCLNFFFAEVTGNNKEQDESDSPSSSFKIIPVMVNLLPEKQASCA